MRPSSVICKHVWRFKVTNSGQCAPMYFRASASSCMQPLSNRALSPPQPVYKETTSDLGIFKLWEAMLLSFPCRSQFYSHLLIFLHLYSGSFCKKKTLIWNFSWLQESVLKKHPFTTNVTSLEIKLFHCYLFGGKMSSNDNKKILILETWLPSTLYLQISEYSWNGLACQAFAHGTPMKQNLSSKYLFLHWDDEDVIMGKTGFQGFKQSNAQVKGCCPWISRGERPMYLRNRAC